MRSQNNEEALVKQYFRERTGTFIDIGANDGITLSNTYAAAQRGWKGVMVEPSPSVFDKLVSNVQGTDVICIQAAISDRQGTYTFYDSGEHLKQGDKALLSTLEITHTAMWDCTFVPVQVRVITFAALMREANITRAELISIDAEGVDMQILKQIDLDKIGCEMLIIEHEHANENEMRNYCRSFGMQQYARNHQNLIMVR
jgi:FkbM family methyltransferase